MKNKNRNWRASTINRNLVNLFKGLQRVIHDSKKMGLHACVRLVSPHSHSVLDADSVSDSDPISADVLVIGRNKDDADALPAACRRGDVDIITIDHLPDRIAEYANDKNVITLLLYHILPDGALCSPGKDWEPAQHTLYITDLYEWKWEHMHASGYVLREGRVSPSSLLFDTRKRTPCSHYTIAIDTEDRIRFQIRVDESSYWRVHDTHNHDNITTTTSIGVSVLDTHTVHIPYCTCPWYSTQDCARSCSDLRVGMQHAFAETAETEVNGNITKRAVLLQNPGIPGSLTVTLKYTNNITEADCERLLDYLLTTEDIVSPFVAELQYDDTTLADEIASMVFPVSHIAYAMKNPVSSNLVSFKIKIDLDPSTINHQQPPLPRSDPILRSIHGNGRIPQ